MGYNVLPVLDCKQSHFSCPPPSPRWKNEAMGGSSGISHRGGGLPMGAMRTCGNSQNTLFFRENNVVRYRDIWEINKGNLS